MGRLSFCFALFYVALMLLDFTSATTPDATQRFKRSPQMPQMPPPPSPPEGFPSPPAMPFRRVVRQLPEQVPEGPPKEFTSANVHSVHPQTSIQHHHAQGSDQMGHNLQYHSSQTMNARSKREARGTGGKFPNRGG